VGIPQQVPPPPGVVMVHLPGMGEGRGIEPPGLGLRPVRAVKAADLPAPGPAAGAGAAVTRARGARRARASFMLTARRGGKVDGGEYFADGNRGKVGGVL
jgi:hypothetical protein